MGKKSSSGAAEATGNEKVEKKKKKRSKTTRHPFKDVNSTTTTTTSVEAPRGCFRFILSNSNSSSSSSTTTKTSLHTSTTPLPITPFSAPIPKSQTTTTSSASAASKTTSNPKSNLPKKNPPRSTTTLSHLHKPIPSSHLLHCHYGPSTIPISIASSGHNTTSLSPQIESIQPPPHSHAPKGNASYLRRISYFRHAICEDKPAYRDPDLETNATPAKDIKDGLATAPHDNVSSKPSHDSHLKLKTDSESFATPSRIEFNKMPPSEQPTARPLDLTTRRVSNVSATPINKLASCSSCLVSTPETANTPPILASVSPEIICGSSSISTPACFAAGHIVVGVSDKRKCRPRGILTVGEGVETVDYCDARVSLVPTPAEASMHWLSSPADQGANKNIIGDGSPELQGQVGHANSAAGGYGFSDGSSTVRLSLVLSPVEASMSWLLSSPSNGLNSNISDKKLPESGGSIRQLTSSEDATPPSDHELYTPSVAINGSCSQNFGASASIGSEIPILQDKTRHRYRRMVENSPFSEDSWGSHNVVSTPVSDSSLERFGTFSWTNVKNSEYQLDVNKMMGDFQAVRLSLDSPVATSDPTDVSHVPRENFQFSFPTTPSNSIDVTQALNSLHDQTFRKEGFHSWEDRTSSSMSCSSFEKMSQLRISWREGLISRIFEMGELDCCRWLLEEEEGVNDCRGDKFKPNAGLEFNPSSKDLMFGDENDRPLAFGSPDFVYTDSSDEKAKRKLTSHGHNSCAESISTEGGGLATSRDSDWILFYKNQLFEI